MWFIVGRTKRKCAGDQTEGLLPISSLGRDTTGGVATGAAWRANGKSACVHGQVADGAATHAIAPTCAYYIGAEHATWVRHFGVATQFLMSRNGLPFWCRDTIFDVMTGISLLES